MPLIALGQPAPVRGGGSGTPGFPDRARPPAAHGRPRSVHCTFPAARSPGAPGLVEEATYVARSPGTPNTAVVPISLQARQEQKSPITRDASGLPRSWLPILLCGQRWWEGEKPSTGQPRRKHTCRRWTGADAALRCGCVRLAPCACWSTSRPADRSAEMSRFVEEGGAESGATVSWQVELD